MNKVLLLAGMLAAFTACQKDEGLVSDTTAASSFTVTIPQSGVQTRAVTDAFGTGTSANRCILEIYHGDQLYNRIVKPVSNKQVTFDNLRLVSSQEYDFVFWADCATANSSSEEGFDDKVYNTVTGGLKAITEKGEFVGNSDERDAFFAKESFEVTGSFTESVTLKRPFGLLVVKTNDLNEIKDEALKPTGYKVAFKGLATTFNALTGEVSGSADVTYTAEELAKADGTISMDFLWATDQNVTASDSPVSLSFKHRMSKMVVRLMKGKDYDGDIPEDAEVYIHNTVPSATIDLSVGIVTRNTHGTAQTIKAKKVNKTQYTAIVVPQRLTNQVPLVEVVMKGVSYMVESKFVFKPGIQHMLSVTISKNPEQVKIEIGGEIEDWED